MFLLDFSFLLFFYEFLFVSCYLQYILLCFCAVPAIGQMAVEAARL